MINSRSSVLIKFFKLNIPKELKENLFFASRSVRLIRSVSVWKMTLIFYLLFNGEYTAKCFLRSSSLLISMFLFFFSWNLWFLFHCSVLLIKVAAASTYLFYLVHMLYRHVMQSWQNSNLRWFFFSAIFYPGYTYFIQWWWVFFFLPATNLISW